MPQPIIVRAISVLYYVSAFFNALAGFLLAMLGVVLILTATAALGTYGPSLVIVFGLIIFGLGFFQFMVARGLWRGREWSRVASVAVSLICFSVGIWQLVVSVDEFALWIMTVLFSSAVGLYLMLPQVRRSFS